MSRSLNQSEREALAAMVARTSPSTVMEALAVVLHGEVYKPAPHTEALAIWQDSLRSLRHARIYFNALINLKA